MKIQTGMECKQTKVIEEYGLDFIGMEFEIVEVNNNVIKCKGDNVYLSIDINEFENYFELIKEEAKEIKDIKEEIFKNDKVEFKIGDTVKLTSKYNGTGFVGGCYSSYSAFFQENNMLDYGKRYTSNKSMESGIYKIVGIGKHKQDNSIIYVLENNNTYKIYLFSNTYNEMVKEIAKEIDSIKKVQKQEIQKSTNKVYTYEMIPHKINWKIKHNIEVIDQIIDSGSESYKLIINGNTTIVILDDGCKGIAKCMESDEYDMDKGVDIAYTKAIIKSSQKKLKGLVK